MIISTVSLKGGAGKTTIAINLAVYYAVVKNKSVVIVDTDVNSNIEMFDKIREQSEETKAKIDYTVLNDEEKFKNNIDDVASRYDVVIIDGRPAIDEMAMMVVMYSDLCILPIKPSPLDMWANDNVFIDKYLDAKDIKPDINAVFVLNGIKPHTNIAYECRLELEGFKDTTDIEILESELSDRVVYASSIVNGIGVIESKNYTAKAEFKRLGNEIDALININKVDLTNNKTL